MSARVSLTCWTSSCIPSPSRELVDLGSRNGTFVNGHAVEQAVVHELDIVTVGHHAFRLVGSGLEEYVDTGSISFEARGLRLPAADGRLLLDGVTFSLEERAFLAVAGPSGSGGHTVVTVTHAMDSVRLCDRLLLLAPGGRPAYFGPPQLAPAAFACHDLQGVFELLNAQPGRDWGEVLTGGGGAIGLAQAPVSPRDAIESAQAEAPRESSPVGAGVRSLSASARRHGSEFGVLVRRHVRVIVGDRRNALLPVLGDILLGMNAHISRDLPFAVARAGLREPDGQSAEADFNRVNGLLGSVTPATLAGEAQRYDPTLVTSVLAPARMYPATVQQLLAAWRSDSWQNAERLVAARTRAQRAAVAESIERGAAGRARLIAALTSNLVTGPSAAVRTAYCERRVSQDAER